MRREDAAHEDPSVGTRLTSAALCLGQDCNTVFDQSEAEACPICGSSATYPLAACLNRGRDTTGPSFVRLAAA